ASDPPVSELVQIDLEGRPVLGLADAPVTIVEYTDYGCPWCAKYAEETYPRLLAEHGGKIRYSVRNFPVGQLHPQAPKAAEAAECAADQERFWEYHDVLFENRTTLDVPSLKEYAAQLGLDRPRFEACLDSGEKADLVQADFQEGIANGVRGTPTFFVNGRSLVGAQPLEVFERIINRESQ
ncbi:MAG: thioredoxin domain-containing protein, partial [Gemmatimonadota bacterium]